MNEADRRKTVLSLATFIANVPPDAVKFMVETRVLAQTEALWSVEAEKLVEVGATEAAEYVLTQATNWAEGGPAGNTECSFHAKWLGERDDQVLSVQRFRAGSLVAGEPMKYDGSAESVIGQLQQHNQVLMEHNIRAQKILVDGFEKLATAQADRIAQLEQRNNELQATVEEVSSKDDDDFEDDLRRLEVLGKHVPRILKEYNSGKSESANGAPKKGGDDTKGKASN